MSAPPQPENDSTREYYGREYSTFGLTHRLNLSPVDEEEEERLESQNRVLRQLFGNRIVLPPFPPSGVSEPTVLDCGFGRGHWLDDLLEEYGPCEATGIDINLGEDEDDDDEDESGEDVVVRVQEYYPLRWNLNASLRGSGLEPRSFDLINSRCIAEGIDSTRWPSYIEDLRKLLKPGGYLQMVEMQYQFQSAAGRRDLGVFRWNELYKRVLESSLRSEYRKNPRAGQSLYGWLRQAGFGSVQGQNLELPIGGWKAGQQQLGIENLGNIQQFLESWSPVAFKNILGIDPQVYSTLMASIVAELRDPQLRLYLNVYVAWGRKPARTR